MSSVNILVYTYLLSLHPEVESIMTLGWLFDLELRAVTPITPGVGSCYNDIFDPSLRSTSSVSVTTVLCTSYSVNSPMSSEGLVISFNLVFTIYSQFIFLGDIFRF